MFAGWYQRVAVCFILAALAACGGGGTSSSALSALPERLTGSSVAFTPSTPEFSGDFTPTALNDSDTVSGIFGFPFANGALWQRGAMDVFGPFTSDSVGINNPGTVIGNIHIGAQNGMPIYQPYIYSGGHLTTVTGPGLSNLFTAINDARLIVGFAQSANGTDTVVVYPKNGTPFEPFSAAKYASSHVFSVNNAGQYIGTYRLQSSSVEQPYIGHGASIQPLPFSGHVVDINDAGTIVGYRDTATGTTGFLWNAAHGLTTLPTLPNTTHVYPTAINNRGEVVGWSHGATVPQAFLYSGGNVIELKSGTPIDINDRGDVLFDYTELPGGFLLLRR